jgi:dihydroorotase
MTIEGKIVHPVKSGTIFSGVNTDGTKEALIEIDETGIITNINKPTGKADFIFKDELIFPGFIDLHVHAREDASQKEIYKEDFKTAGEAAINGGVVAIAEMPNNPIPPVDDKTYMAKKELAKNCDVDVVLYAGIGRNTNALAMPVPYKAYQGPSVGDLFFKSFEDLEDSLKNYKGQNISFHCEDPNILEKYKNEPAHELRRPKEAEILGIESALKMIEKHNLKGKICHVSTKEGMELIINAKKRGINITCEAAPHHLFFDDSMINEGNRFNLQVNPPIRSKGDRLALIEFLKNGDIDFIATDHAPHTKEEKMKGASGMPHLDTYGLFVCWLMKEYNFTPWDIARICSFNPGKFVNQFTQLKYGKIEKGYAGSLTVIGMNRPTKVKAENLKTKCGWSPFEGMEFPGETVATIIKGKVYKKLCNPN